MENKGISKKSPAHYQKTCKEKLLSLIAICNNKIEEYLPVIIVQLFYLYI